jgi:hypothetical protein
MEFEWEQLSPRVGVMTDRKQRNGWFQLVYLGFTNQALANKFVRWLAKTSPAKRVELRAGKRLAGMRWELKIDGLDPVILHRCYQKDLARYAPPATDEAELEALVARL